MNPRWKEDGGTGLLEGVIADEQIGNVTGVSNAVAGERFHMEETSDCHTDSGCDTTGGCGETSGCDTNSGCETNSGCGETSNGCDDTSSCETNSGC